MNDDLKDQLIAALVEALNSYEEWVRDPDRTDLTEDYYECPSCKIVCSSWWLKEWKDDPDNHNPECKRVKAFRLVELLKRRQELKAAFEEDKEQFNRIVEGK